MDWVVLSRFNSIASQNTSQSITIHTNTYGIEITEQGLRFILWVAYGFVYIYGSTLFMHLLSLLVGLTTLNS
jgi:hypothetical protein